MEGANDDKEMCDQVSCYENKNNLQYNTDLRSCKVYTEHLRDMLGTGFSKC